MNLTRDIIDQLSATGLSASERAILQCELAKEFEDAGNYESAADAMKGLWATVGELPKLEGLDETSRATVLLRAGALTGWLGSTRQIEGSQELAKNLLSESDLLFQSIQLAE